MSIRNRILAAGTLALFTVAPAFAQTATDTFDPTAYAAKVTAAVAGILVVGGAVFGLNVAIKSTKWARRAL